MKKEMSKSWKNAVSQIIIFQFFFFGRFLCFVNKIKRVTVVHDLSEIGYRINLQLGSLFACSLLLPRTYSLYRLRRRLRLQ